MAQAIAAITMVAATVHPVLGIGGVLAGLLTKTRIFYRLPKGSVTINAKLFYSCGGSLGFSPNSLLSLRINAIHQNAAYGIASVMNCRDLLMRISENQLINGENRKIPLGDT